MKLKVQELNRRRWLIVRQSGLAVIVFAEEGETAGLLVDSMREPIIRWKAKRNGKAQALSLVFTVPTWMHRSIMRSLYKLYRDDRQLGHILDHLPTATVHLNDEHGVPVRAFVLDAKGLVDGQFREVPVVVEAPSPASSKMS